MGRPPRAVGAALANRVFDLIGGFAEFGFCKSHAMSFALLCYRSAFLKRYYPLEFYCALLNNQPMGFYIPEVVVGDARRHGVAALPVDVNRSHWACTIEEDHLRLGFRYVKEMGEDRAERITAARAAGPFSSLEDCCVRTGLDKESLKNLVLVGAFDGLERTRRQLLWRLGSGMAREGGIEFGRPEKVPLDEMNHTEELFTDYQIQGFSAKRQLLAEFRPRLARAGAVTSAVVAKAPSGTKLTLAGLNVCLQMPPTAKGFAFMTLEDEEGLVNVVVRPEVYKVYRQVVRLEPLVVVTGDRAEERRRGESDCTPSFFSTSATCR